MGCTGLFQRYRILVGYPIPFPHTFPRSRHIAESMIYMKLERQLATELVMRGIWLSRSWEGEGEGRRLGERVEGGARVGWGRGLRGRRVRGGCRVSWWGGLSAW